MRCGRVVAEVLAELLESVACAETRIAPKERHVDAVGWESASPRLKATGTDENAPRPKLLTGERRLSVTCIKGDEATINALEFNARRLAMHVQFAR